MANNTGGWKERSEGGGAADLAVIGTYPIKGWPERGISQATAERYQVRCSVDEVTGQPSAFYYPYFDKDGNVTGYKKRTVATKEFAVVGKMKGLFGQKQCKENAQFVLVVEGEHDCLAAWEMLSSLGKNYNIVSIPNGANEDGTIDGATRRELEWLGKHSKVAVCLDSDLPGQKTAVGLADLLASQAQVRIVSLPYKDAGELLKRRLAKEFYSAIGAGKDYRPEAVVEGSEITIEQLQKPKERGVELQFPKLQKMTWGLHKGQICLVTAGTGIGKSTFVREIAFDLANKGYKVANIALETVLEDSARYYIAMDNNVPAYKLMFNPNLITQEAYQKSYNKLLANNRMSFYKHFGSIGQDELAARCHYFAKALNVDFIIFDHVSMAIAGNESRDERKDIDVLFEMLARLVTETGVGVVAVMHLKRVQGKSFNKGGEVELTDLRGSAGAEQMSFSVWALERDQQGDRKDLLQVRVLKNRLTGFTGVADSLMYNHETGRLTAFTPEEATY